MTNTVCNRPISVFWVKSSALEVKNLEEDLFHDYLKMATGWPHVLWKKKWLISLGSENLYSRAGFYFFLVTWASHLTSILFHFLIRKIILIIISASQICCETQKQKDFIKYEVSGKCERWWLYPVLWIHSLAKRILLLFLLEEFQKYRVPGSGFTGDYYLSPQRTWPQTHFHLYSGWSDAGNLGKGKKPRKRKKITKERRNRGFRFRNGGLELPPLPFLWELGT